jgi:hypothetical protein
LFGHTSLHGLHVTMDRYGHLCILHLFRSDDHELAMDAIAADMFG